MVIRDTSLYQHIREYHGLNKDGEEVEMQHALTTKIGKGQSIRSPLGEGLLGMCLGEKRRLLIPDKELRNKYKEVSQPRRHHSD